MEIFVGVGGDAEEEVAQVAEGVESVVFGTLNQAVVDGGGVAPAVAAHEEVIFASDADAAQPLFGGVVVDVEIAVVEVAVQGLPLVEGVVDGFADGTLG